MAVCDKWVALKICEFVACVACLVAKRVSDDDSQRLSLLQQKLSREWSLLRSVTWDAEGSSFGDALYGGYVLITFGLLLGRVFQEVPRGRRVLEGFLLGVGLLLFLTIGGLELASLDSVPHNLIVNGAVLGSLSLVVAALFLIDLMGPRVTTAAHQSQTDVPAVSIAAAPVRAAPTLPLHAAANGHLPNERIKDSKDTTDGALMDKKDKDESVLFERPKHGYTKFADDWEKDDLGKSKFGSYRNGGVERFDAGNYVRLSDPLAEPDRLHYERELAKFNEKYFREYLDSKDGPPTIPVREEYLPELQTPIFSKVKSGRIRSLYDELSPSYRNKSPPKQRAGSTPTLQQLEEYLRGSQHKGREARPRAETPSATAAALFPMEPIEEARDSLEGRASGTPTDPGYVQYAADRWPDSRHSTRTPRHSPTE